MAGTSPTASPEWLMREGNIPEVSEQAQAILDEVVRPRGENQTMLNFAFQHSNKETIAKVARAPGWVIERYLNKGTGQL